MTELSCQQCREHTAELALGVLCGRQRAEVLAHLDRCTACQDLVGELTVTVDRLIDSLPEAESPAGFEQRVLTAVVTPPPRARRRWRPAAALVLAVGLGAGGWILGRASPAAPPPAADARDGVRTVMFSPLTADGRQVGQAYVYPGLPSWMYLLLDGDDAAASGTVGCEVVHRDGSRVQLGTFSLTQGYRGWGTPAPIDTTTLAAIRLISSDGHTLATARFSAPASARAGHTTPAQTAPAQPPPGAPTPPSNPRSHPTADHDSRQHQDHQQTQDHHHSQGDQQRDDHHYHQGRGSDDYQSPDSSGEPSTAGHHVGGARKSGSGAENSAVPSRSSTVGPSVGTGRWPR